MSQTLGPLALVRDAQFDLILTVARPSDRHVRGQIGPPKRAPLSSVSGEGSWLWCVNAQQIHQTDSERLM